MSLSGEVFKLLNDWYDYEPEAGNKDITYSILREDDIWLYFSKANKKDDASLGFYFNEDLDQEVLDNLSTALVRCVQGKGFSAPVIDNNWIYCLIPEDTTLTPEEIIDTLNNLAPETGYGVKKTRNETIKASESQDSQEDTESAALSRKTLARVCRSLWIDGIFISGSFLAFHIGRGFGGSLKFFIYLGIATLLAGMPILINFIIGGFTKDFFYWQRFEVITTYKDGRKESDHGLNSGPINIVKFAFLGLFLIWAFALITPIKYAYLCIKYLIYLIIARKKSVLMWTGFIPIAMCVLWLIYALNFWGFN
ncbi:MAG: hypothetical protein LBU88_08920 [Treponema sp.]|jgi:hypothetical protein|nr:hypothetical protein [Treponema sp.]